MWSGQALSGRPLPGTPSGTRPRSNSQRSGPPGDRMPPCWHPWIDAAALPVRHRSQSVVGVISTPDLGVFTVAAGGVLCLFVGRGEESVVGGQPAGSGLAAESAQQVARHVDVALRSMGQPNSIVRAFDFWDDRYEGRRLFSEVRGPFPSSLSPWARGWSTPVSAAGPCPMARGWSRRS